MGGSRFALPCSLLVAIGTPDLVWYLGASWVPRPQARSLKRRGGRRYETVGDAAKSSVEHGVITSNLYGNRHGVKHEYMLSMWYRGRSIPPCRSCLIPTVR
jgi:hypothetical protein